MADHNEDLLDDDGLDSAYEVDLADADEDALLADDYERAKVVKRFSRGVNTVSFGLSTRGSNLAGSKRRITFWKDRAPTGLSHRKIIERLPEDEDFIEIGIDDDMAEDLRNDTGENGNIFENENDSDDEVKERSRFKTERNITLTPARSNKPIPETLDAVPVKTVVQQVRVRGGAQQLGTRRGRGIGHIRGRGRGGQFFPPNFHHPQPNFNHFQGHQGPQGGYYPPPHQQYGPPQMPPPAYQQPPPYQQPAPQPYYNQPPPAPQPQPPPQQVAPPVIPPGQKIHVNPHFKNNLGNIWDGISSSWNQQNSSQQVQPANDQFGQPQREWAEGPSQDYYNQAPQHGTAPQYNQFENQYFQGNQEQFYQPNTAPPPQPYNQPPPGPPPSQPTNHWDSNSNYYNQPGPPSNQFSPAEQNPPPQGPPGPGFGPPGPPVNMGPPPMGPPNHFMPRGPPPMRGRGMPTAPGMGIPPRKMMRMQHPNAPQPGNVRMRLNVTSNFTTNKFGNDFVYNKMNQGNQFRPPTPHALLPKGKLFITKQLRNEGTKKLKPPLGNIVPIKTEEVISIPPEDEDEETKAYRKKIEEQKKMREDLLRQKEERRKVAAQQKLQQLEEGEAPATTPGTDTTYKTVRIMQSDGTTVLRKLTLAQIAKLKKITPAAATNKQPPKKPEEPSTKIVSVENLSASTTHRQLMDMARTVGVVEKVTLDSDSKKAIIRFMSVEAAQTFVRRNHRKMVDLSMIQATLVPDPPPQTGKVQMA